MGGITERIDAITGIPEEARKAKAPIPKSVKIELTGRCNFKCSFCARSMALREQKEMDRDTFERLLLEMRAAGVEEIGLFYLGESFMCKWLEEAISFAKHTAGFPYVFLTTNGSLCTPDRLHRCFASGLDSLKFSLNYADEAQFTDIARVNPRMFRAMIQNIKAARQIRDTVEHDTGHRCGLYASYIAYDGEQGERMAEVIEEVAPYLDEVYGLPLYNQASLVEHEEQARGWDIKAGNPGRLDNMRQPIPCWAVFTEGHITWDGKLSACCFDHDGRFHMADLTAVDFATGWNSLKFQALREAHLRHDIRDTPCETCVAYQ